MKINDLNDVPTAEQLKRESERLKYRRDFFRTLSATIGSLLVFAAVCVLISYLIFPVLRVTGSGMGKTLSSSEIVLCSKSSSVKKGDVIAFYHNKKILIKRIIGFSGDIISIDDKGTVSVNGVVLDEPYAENSGLGECDIEFPYTVPSGRYFVLGDDRAASVDSRYSGIGCVAEEDIIGKVGVVVWPPGSIRKPE